MLDFLELLFIGTPWPVMALLLLLLSWKNGRLESGGVYCCCLDVSRGICFWDKSMSTMALVGASVFICLLIGAPLGILAAKNPRFNRNSKSHLGCDADHAEFCLSDSCHCVLFSRQTACGISDSSICYAADDPIKPR